MNQNLAFALSAVALISCRDAYGWQDYQLRRIKKNVESLSSFEGRLVQTGLLPSGEAVTMDVLYKRPDKFIGKIATPAPWTGTTVVYNGTTLLFHYPSHRFAIRISNLPITPQDHERFDYAYWQGVKQFEYELRGTSQIAGHPAVELRHRAKNAATRTREGYTKVFDKFSFPLAGESVFANKARYGYRYDSIKFNSEITDDWFSMDLPAGTTVAEWDLAAPTQTPEAVKKQASFEVRFPDQNPLGLVNKRVVRAAGIIPAFGALYQRGAFFALVTATPDLGTTEYGVAIDGGHLILGPEISSFNFALRGTRYTILGNVPHEELITLAQVIQATR